MMEPTTPYIRIQLQSGPISEVGVNGAQIDDVIEWCITTLEAFNVVPYNNAYNVTALYHLKQAANQLRQRTAERERRGVEGTSRP